MMHSDGRKGEGRESGGTGGSGGELTYYEVMTNASDPTAAANRRLKGKVTVLPQSVEACQVFMRPNAFQFGQSHPPPSPAVTPTPTPTPTLPNTIFRRFTLFADVTQCV